MQELEKTVFVSITLHGFCKSRFSTEPEYEVSTGCRGAAALPQSSSWVAGESPFQHLKHLFLLYSWQSLQGCFSHIFSFLSPSCSCHGIFLLLLKYIILVALPPFLMSWSLASSGSLLELAGIGSGHGGSFWQKSPQYHNLATWTQWRPTKPAGKIYIVVLPQSLGKIEVINLSSKNITQMSMTQKCAENTLFSFNLK